MINLGTKNAKRNFVPVSALVRNAGGHALVERLLRNPRQDIAAIAGLCGWASGSVLRKSFKERRNGLFMRECRAGQAR